MAERKRHKQFSGNIDVQHQHVTDKEKLTQLFPEEIWTLVFKYHASSVDLRNVAQSSKYLETVLFRLRPQWLFPFVWQLIAAKLITQDRKQFATWLTSLFTLRFVCKTWSKAIDLTFERREVNHTIGTIAWDQTLSARDSKFCLYVTNQVCPQTRAKINRYLKYFKTTHPSTGNRSPIISKTVLIYSRSDEISHARSSWKACLNVLTTYGRFIRHCKITIHHYEQLGQFLALLPNLQTLSVSYDYQNLHQEEYPQTEVAKWNRYSLPPLTQLKVLCAGCIPHKIAQDLINVCSSLTSFDYYSKGFDITGLFSHPLQQLRVWVNLTNYINLKTMQYSWPLTHLELIFEKNCFVEWPELMVLLHQKWNKTLKRLKITLPGRTRQRHADQITHWSFMPLLKLQQLTHLTLVMNSLHALDFILPVRQTLQYLSLQYEFKLEESQNQYIDDFTEMKEKQVIKIHGHIHGERLIGSNIWTLFPNLMELKQEIHRSNCFGRVFRRPFDGNFNDVYGWSDS